MPARRAFAEMDPGVYEITEQSVPDAYLLDPRPQKITLTPDKLGVVQLQDYPKPTLTVKKIDSATGKPVEGARFHFIYGSNHTFTGEINDLGEVEYTILETPVRTEVSPKRENPVLEKPVLDNPEQGEPEQEKPAQLNTNKSNTKKQNTKLSITQSFRPSDETAATDGGTDGAAQRADIREQIEYDAIVTDFNRSQLDELVEIMLEVAMNRSSTTRIGRDAEYRTSYVRQRFAQIMREHIERVLDGIRENTTRVRNTKAYLMAALFNAVSTLDNHYAMLVNHDLYGGNDP